MHLFDRWLLAQRLARVFCAGRQFAERPQGNRSPGREPPWWNPTFQALEKVLVFPLWTVLCALVLWIHFIDENPSRSCRCKTECKQHLMNVFP